MSVPRALACSLLITTLVNLAMGAQTEKNPPAMKLYGGENFRLIADYDTTLSYDNRRAMYYFPLPDEWGDRLFNVRFEAPDSCRLMSAEFYFTLADDGAADLPDIYVFVSESTGKYPAFLPEDFPDTVTVLSNQVISGNDINLYPDPTVVDFAENAELNFSAGTRFHIGWDLVNPGATDTTLAILSDDGIPETDHSVEYWGENETWGTIYEDWELGVNFLIRAQVLIFEDGSYVQLKPEDLPAEFALEGPYPNPFNPETSLIVSLERSQSISLGVYDLTGRLIEEIVGDILPAGKNLIRWRPKDLPSGTYLIKLTSDERVVATKATLLR